MVIKIYIRIPTDVKIENNKPDIFVLDKEEKCITLIEVEITILNNLQII